MTDPKWFLTSFGVGDDYIEELHHMLASFRRFHPRVPVIVGENPVGSDQSWGQITCYKAQWLADVYRAWKSLGDMVWIDADARIRKPIIPPDGDFVFGAKKYARWSTGTVWMRGDCQSFLDEWSREALDAAFDEEALERALYSTRIEPYELPDELTSVCSLGIHKYKGRIERDSAIVHWNRSRLALGHLDEWPPTECEREEAMA